MNKIQHIWGFEELPLGGPNRLLFDVGKGTDTMRQSNRVEAQTEHLGDAIDRNILANETYAMFGKGQEARQLLEAAAAYRYQNNPENPTGLREDHPNIQTLIRETGTLKADLLREQQEADMLMDQELQGSYTRGKAALDSLDRDPKAFLTDSHALYKAPYIDAAAGPSVMAAAPSGLSGTPATTSGPLEALPFMQILGDSESSYNKAIKAFIKYPNRTSVANAADVWAVKQSAISLLVNIGIIDSSLDQAQRNFKFAKDVLARIPKTDARGIKRAQRYMNFIEKEEIPRLLKHQTFALAALEYFFKLEATGIVKLKNKADITNDLAALTVIPNLEDLTDYDTWTSGAADLISGTGLDAASLKALFQDAAGNFQLHPPNSTDYPIASDYLRNQKGVLLERPDIIEGIDFSRINNLLWPGGNQRSLDDLLRDPAGVESGITQLKGLMIGFQSSEEIDSRNQEALKKTIDELTATPVTGAPTDALNKIHNFVALRREYYKTAFKAISERLQMLYDVQNLSGKTPSRTDTLAILEQRQKNLAEAAKRPPLYALEDPENEANRRYLELADLRSRARLGAVGSLIDAQRRMTELRFRGSELAVTEDIRSSIEQGNTFVTENMRLSMEEYLMVYDKLQKADKLPNDKASRQLVILAALVGPKGLPAVLESRTVKKEYKVDPAKPAQVQALEIMVGLRTAGDTQSPLVLTEVLKIAGLKGLGHLTDFEKMAQSNSVDWVGAFERYFEAGYWTDPKKSVNTWMENFDRPEKGAKNATIDPIAYTILDEVLTRTEGNLAFLEALKTRKPKAREMLAAFIKEFQAKAEFAKHQLEADIDYQEAVEEGGGTLTEQFIRTTEGVVGGIFDSSLHWSERGMNAIIAYTVVSKGIFGHQGLFPKLVKGVGAGVFLGMMYEKRTGRSALSDFLGIQSPDEMSKGTFYNRMAQASEIDPANKEGHTALRILRKKKLEDVLKWWDDRHKYGYGQKDKIWDPMRSLLNSGLVSRSELDSIYPKETNPQKAALFFHKIVETQLIHFGRKAAGGRQLSEPELIQLGRDDLYEHFTQKGVKEAIAGGRTYLAKTDSEKVQGGYKFTWEEAFKYLTAAQEVQAAMEEHEGLPGLWAWFKESLKWIKEKGLPAWFKAWDFTKEKADEWIEKIYKEYGVPAWEAMTEYAEKGWSFAREQTGEIKVWWREGEGAIRLKRTAGKGWEIIKTGLTIPVVATMKATELTADKLYVLLQRLEAKVAQWDSNELQNVGFDPFNANMTERMTKLDPFFKTHGWGFFGRFEKDFKNPGQEAVGSIMTRPDVYENPTARFDFEPPQQGYISFIGLEKDPGMKLPEKRLNAYREGVNNLVKFLTTARRPDGTPYLDYLDPNDPFTVAVRSGNPDKVREAVEPFIERYGSLDSAVSGYAVFLRVPVPLTAASRVERIGGEIMRQNTEYDKKRNNKWRYDDLDEYKKTMVFTAGDMRTDTLRQYIEIDSAGRLDLQGEYVNKFLREFQLLDPKDLPLVFNNAQAVAEGEPFEVFMEGDKMKQGFFDALKSNFKDDWFNYHHPTKSYEFMRSYLNLRLGKTASDDFSKWHEELNRQLERAGGASVETRVRRLLDSGYLEQAYRRYLMGKLVLHKDDNVLPGSKPPIPKSKFIQHFSEKFFREEAQGEITIIVSSVAEGVGVFVRAVGDLLNKMAGP